MDEYLQETFKDTPGKQYVNAGHIEMQNEDGSIIEKRDWGDSIRPCMTVGMVMTSSVLGKRDTFCQRCLASWAPTSPDEEDGFRWKW